MSDDLYNVDKYTDEQLYAILDIDNPTDRELEAKILSLIHKYKNAGNEEGDRIAIFFENVYTRFFDTGHPDENIQEGFASGPMREDKSDTNVSEKVQSIAPVQLFEYSKDKLQINPLLRETITRVISVDSQFRDSDTNSSTDFTFDLSEPLRDVVSLKLYSINIPYDWYNIKELSNMFYLSSEYNNKQYEIKVIPGTYTTQSLVDDINTSFINDVSNGSARDIVFNGAPLLSYDNKSSKTTFNLDIQNTFNESYYSVELAGDVAKYMGYTNTTEDYIYSPCHVYSNKTYMKTVDIGTILETKPKYNLDANNNYFTVEQYIYIDGIYTPLNRHTVNTNFYGNASRDTILERVNESIKSSNLFDSSSKLERVIDTYLNTTYFRFNLVFNRNSVKYVPNSKMRLIFPIEDLKTHDETKFIIWTKHADAKYNCFYFDDVTNDFSYIISDNVYTSSDYVVRDNTNITFKCIRSGYNISDNDISLNLSIGTYNLYQFVDTINSAIKDNLNNSKKILFLEDTNAYLDIQNKFNLNIDLLKNFTNADYKIFVDATSVLRTPSGTPGCDFSSNFMDVGNPGTIMNGKILFKGGNAGYKTNRTEILRINTLSSNNNIIISLLQDPLKEPGSYSNATTFITYIKNSICEYSIDNQRPFASSTIATNLDYLLTLTEEQQNAAEYYIDVSLNIQCRYSLTENDYKVEFVDPDLTSGTVWDKLRIDSSYNLSENKNQNNPYASIVGRNTLDVSNIELNDSNNKIIIKTEENPAVPQDNIQIQLKNGTYTISTLLQEINRNFIANPKTFGSSISQTADGRAKLFINVNNIYTTSDYKLVFFNNDITLTCLSGLSSIRNRTWDTTIGWVLGFRSGIQYSFQSPTSVSKGGYTYTPIEKNGQRVNTIVSLTGDSNVNVDLYNYFLLSLDDYIQNHLNDGLVTIARSETTTESLDYSYKSRIKCQPGTNSLYSGPVPRTNRDLTFSELYSMNQPVVSNPASEKNIYSSGPFVKDLFGIIPIKIPGAVGSKVVEYGGSLQNQTRVYFGPVTIRKMTIQLFNDRGALVDLNGSNWSFSFVCEQLYRAPN